MKRTEDGPGRRGAPAMVFDGSRIFAFGGTFALYPAPSTPYNDAWRYDGSQTLGMTIVQAPTPQEALYGQPVTFSVVAPGANFYQWYRNNTVLFDDQFYSGTTTDTLRINAATTWDGAMFIVRVSAGCGGAAAGAQLRLHDVHCYANCDHSTALPLLSANDFQCFLNLYAAGDSQANCDGSTSQPTLNVNDFQCFLGKYAMGC